MMPKRRAAKVCESCHSHKVRCDIRSAENPCSRCAAIGEECQIRVRKQYPVRRKTRSSTVRDPGISKDKNTSISPSLLRPSHVRIVAAAITKPSARTASIFVGDGGYGSILDAVGGPPNRSFKVYATAEKPLHAEDLDYLNAKGCFTLPEQSEELLQAYFKYVHPSFPVIDGPAFSLKLGSDGIQGINLLLLWSMFSISASYVPTLPRIACKETFVHKAKLLFDISPEHDKIVLVQSALLLSFWFVDTEDVKQSWYWTSIAFGIAQSLGLHHDVEAIDEQEVAQQRSWWHHIWQCCLIRDVWLAFGMGRPLRLIASDSSILQLERLEGQFVDLTLHGRKVYSPNEAMAFESMWRSFVTTSTILRGVITGAQLAPLNCELSQGRIDMLETADSSRLITHVRRHLGLHHFAAAIALARARDNEEELESATDGSIAVVQAFLDDETVEFASPVTIPLVIPAMVNCLNISKSGDQSEGPEKRELSNDRLDVVSKFFTALEDNYPSASILSQVLDASRHEIEDDRSHRRKSADVS